MYNYLALKKIRYINNTILFFLPFFLLFASSLFLIGLFSFFFLNSFVIYREYYKIINSNILYLVLCNCIFFLLISHLSVDPYRSAIEIIKLTLVLFFGIFFVKHSQKLEFNFEFVMWGGGFALLIVFLFEIIFYVLEIVPYLDRFEGISSAKWVRAITYISLLLIPSLFYSFFEKKYKTFVILLACLFWIVLEAKLTAKLALICSVSAIPFFLLLNFSWVKVIFYGIIGYILTLPLWFHSLLKIFISSHFYEYVKASGKIRFEMWIYFINKIFEKPFLGWGISVTTKLPGHKEYIQLTSVPNHPILSYPHNFFIEIWVGQGLVGAIFFALFLLMVLGAIKRSYQNNISRCIILCLTVAIFVFLLANSKVYSTLHFSSIVIATILTVKVSQFFEMKFRKTV